MPRLPRRLDELNDAIEDLDAHLELHKGNAAMAWQSLSKANLQFIEEEIAACVRSDRYYLENYHVVKTEEEGLKTLYPFWDAQEIYYERILAARQRGILTGNYQTKLIILKARQLGLSTVTEGYISYRTFFFEAVNSLIVAQDPDQADYLFQMTRRAYDNLPWWMRPQVRYEAKGQYLVLDKKDPGERQIRPGLDSGIYVEAANKMTGVAIGKTMRNLHASELSQWRYGGHILATQIFPTMNASDTFQVLESTARGKGGFWYNFWLDSIEGRLDWDPVFIPFYRVRKYSTPIPKDETPFKRTEEEVSIAKKVLEEDEYAMSDENFNWRRNKIAETKAINNGDESMFFQEYPINWRQAFQASGICAFDKKKLMKMMDCDALKPIWTGEISLDLTTKQPKLKVKKFDHSQEPPPQVMPGHRLYIWEGPQKGEEFYIGADVAQGIEGGDFSCASVYRIGRGQKKDVQVAEWHGWINPTAFAHVLCALGWFYNTAEIACEINDCGRDVNSEMFRNIEYPRLYQWKHLDKIKNFMTDFFGWQTNVKTRASLIRAMREAITDEYIVIRSMATLDQMTSFGAMEDGSRIEGMGDNDDRVFGNMITINCAHEMDWGTPRETREERDLRADEKNSGRDFANTDFSPIHDRNGLRREMVQRREVPAEVLMYEDVQYPDPGRADDRWKNW